MKTLKERQLEFLEETINYYNSNNRGIKDNGHGGNVCSYEQGCAIGRKIADKEVCKNLDSFRETSVQSLDVFELLPFELQALGHNFLMEVQMLHDDPLAWNETGLSPSGKVDAGDIKRNFELN